MMSRGQQILGTLLLFSTGIILFQFKDSGRNENPAPVRAPAAAAPLAVHPPALPVLAAPTPTALPLLTTLGSFETELKKLNACYTEDCGFPKMDPRADYFLVGAKIKRQLLDLSLLVRRNKIADEKVNLLAREFLENSDGHVQEAALDLMATQAPNLENMDSILKNVLQGADANLIYQALLELQRYRGDAEQTRIQAALAQAMISGSPFVAVAVAEHIDLFLNPRSFSFFAHVADKMESGSNTKRALQNFLQEFRHKSSEG